MSNNPFRALPMNAQDATAAVSHFEKEYAGKTFLADDQNNLCGAGFSQFVRRDASIFGVGR
jgi:hypothetical protein